MEHLNRDCKEAISGLGANITDKSITRVGKCLGRVKATLENFDSVNGIQQESGHHTSHSTEVDLNKILKQLQDVAVFTHKPGRIHRSFPKLVANVTNKLSRDKLLEWMHDNMEKHLLYH